MGCFLTVLQSLDVVEITTAEQLLNMDGYRYYKLMNDIDLGGMQWDNAGDFVGYFDGNNHTISNLSVVTSYENEIVEIGLFNNASGIIKNLNLADVLIVVDLTSTTSQGYDAFVGGFSAHSNNLLLDNCTISGIISVENKTSGETFVSSFVGQVTDETYFETHECTENINISST